MTAFTTFEGLPVTAEGVARHEIAHGVASALACAIHHEDLLSKHVVCLTVTVKATGVGGECAGMWDDDVPDDVQRKVAGLCAVGPVALLPLHRMKLAVQRCSFGHCGALSDPDIEAMQAGRLLPHEMQQITLATFAHLRLTGEDKVSKLCNILLRAHKRSADIPATVLVPRPAITAALAAADRMKAALAAGEPIMECIR